MVTLCRWENNHRSDTALARTFVRPGSRSLKGQGASYVHSDRVCCTLPLLIVTLPDIQSAPKIPASFKVL